MRFFLFVSVVSFFQRSENQTQALNTDGRGSSWGFTMTEEDRPLDALNGARGKRVMVELKNGKQFVGVLRAFDIHINTVLEDAEERMNGELVRKIGKIFLRGDTIILIAPSA